MGGRMKKISISELRKLSVEEIKEQIPLAITSDNEPFAYVVNLEDVIVVADLHPRVQNMLKMQEKRARGGMPPPEVLTKKEIDE